MSSVIVIGGGPAGMMAAISAAECGARVSLLEKNEKLGKKLFITGKGRCNLTNAADIEEFFRAVISNPKFLYSAFYSFTNEQTIAFFESLGLPVENKISLHSLRSIPNPDPSVKVCASEKERLDLLRSLHHQLILADDPSLTVCPSDNVTLRFAMPVTRGAQVARHLPMMGLRGADFIAEAVEEYLQTLH